MWLVGIFYPDFKPSNVFNARIFSGDWLPAPKNYSTLLTPKNSDGTYGTVYEPAPEYNGYNTANGGYYGSTANTSNTQVWNGNTSAFAEKSLYLRNLSIYEGGNIAYNTTIVGEARDIMFKNGAFPIFVLDSRGKIVSSTQAVNTGTWAATGWVRFQARIPSRLPAGTNCMLLFISDNQPVKVGMSVKCN